MFLNLKTMYELGVQPMVKIAKTCEEKWKSRVERIAQGKILKLDMRRKEKKRRY